LKEGLQSQVTNCERKQEKFFVTAVGFYFFFFIIIQPRALILISFVKSSHKLINKGKEGFFLLKVCTKKFEYVLKLPTKFPPQSIPKPHRVVVS